MALITIPFTSIYLVEHVGGGAILHVGGGYIANAMVPAHVMEAFAVASGVLSQFGASVGTIATATTSVLTSPPVLATAAILAVAAGAYCYFHGIPAPIEAALSKAGLGAATSHGFAISPPQLTVALILLGGAGYICFRFYKSRTALRAAQITGPKQPHLTIDSAEAISRAAFGAEAWNQFGRAIWLKLENAGRGAVEGSVATSVALAESLADAVKSARARATHAAQVVTNVAADLSERAHAAGESAANGAAIVASKVRFSVVRWLSARRAAVKSRQ